MKIGYERVSRKLWYSMGGLACPECFRRQAKNGGRLYFVFYD